MYYRKLPLIIISYRYYKKFSNENVLDSVKEVFSTKNTSIENAGIDFFLNTSSKVLNRHPPCKKKYIGGYKRHFMNKCISKDIMKRSKLRNKFLKTRMILISLITKNKETFVYPLYEKKKQNTMQI